MILANWLRRVSEEPHSSTAPNRLAEALLLPWSVSMSSDEPYWRPPTPRSVWSFSWRLMGSNAVSGQLPVGRQTKSDSLLSQIGMLGGTTSAAARYDTGVLGSTRPRQSRHSLTGRCRVRKMKRPESWTSLSDRPNHLALPHRREAGRRRDGCGLQGRRHPAGSFRSVEVPSCRRSPRPAGAGAFPARGQGSFRPEPSRY